MFKNILCVLLFMGTGTFAKARPPEGISLTDAQIGKIMITINEGEMDAAKLAKSKAQSNKVKEFAKMMTAEHKKNEDDVKNISKRIKGEEESDLAKTLKEDAKNSNKELQKNDKTTFDHAYIEQQIMMHEKALSTLSDTLIPNATDADLKSHLQRTHAAVEKHLEHAKKLKIP